MIDGILKGVGEQVHSMKINIADSALSLILSVVLIPRFGIKGYVGSVYVCECMNCLFSFVRLRRVTGVGIDIVRQVLPFTVAAVFSVLATSVLPELLGKSSFENVRIMLCIGIYLSTCFAMGTLWEKHTHKKNKFPNTVEINCAG